MIVKNCDFNKEDLPPINIDEKEIRLVKIEMDCDGGEEKVRAWVIIREEIEVYELPYTIDLFPAGSIASAFTAMKNRVREILLTNEDFQNKTII